MKKFIPHEYQRYAAEYIITHPVTALLLDMGLGKTVTTLTAVNELMYDYFEISKVLVIAPLRVARDTWPAEIQKWEHLQNLTYSVAVGTEAERLRALKDIYIINRENVQWLIEESGAVFNYDMLIIDELSSFKNHDTKRFKSLMKMRPKVRRVVGLTGTPSSNGLMDLWAEFRLLDMGQRLGRFIGKYRNDYFLPDKYKGNIVYSYRPLPDAEQQIYDKISDITISMKSTDHLKMPELIISEYPVKLSEEERQHYEELKEELVLELPDGDVTASNADIIEAANGKPVLVAYWFKHDLARIQERLNKLHIPFATMDKADSISRWQRGELPVGLIHPASAGHGLNLQSGGSTLIWFGLTWSLELYQQTNARLWRQGQQSKTVIIQHIITTGTIDRKIMSALQKKEETQNALIDAVKAELGGKK